MLEDELRRLVKDAVREALKEHHAAPLPPAVDDDGRTVFSLPEVRARWNVSDTYLRGLRQRGLIKSMKFGTRTMFAVAEVLRIEQQGLPSLGHGIDNRSRHLKSGSRRDMPESEEIPGVALRTPVAASAGGPHHAPPTTVRSPTRQVTRKA